MKNRSNKKKELIKALASRDKEKLKSALAINLPEKWITIELDNNAKTIKYLNKVVSEVEMKAIIEEEEKSYNLKIVLMSFDRHDDDSLEDNWFFLDNCEQSLTFRQVTLDLS